MKASPELKKMLEEGVGWRCGKPQVTKPSKVVAFEVGELGNDDDLPQYCAALGVSKCDLESVVSRLKEMDDGRAIWLGLKKNVKAHYCDGSKPESYAIPKGSLVLCDLGPDGALVVFK